MCTLFMESMDNPFASLEKILEKVGSLSGEYLIVVDVHGESTSEKMAIGHFLDGKNFSYWNHTLFLLQTFK